MEHQAPPFVEANEEWKPYLHGASPILFDSRGARRTASLFAEVSQDPNNDPIFTMKDYDAKGCLSAYLIFMNSVDEGDAAMKMVGGMGHWRKLLRKDWFMNGSVELGFEGLVQWRQDMLTRDMTRAKGIYEDRMREGDLAAARAMVTLIEKMNKIYLSMGQTPKTTSTSRRGTQQETRPKVVDLDSEIARLTGNKQD